MSQHRGDLDKIAAALLVHEELDREEVDRVLKGLPIPAPLSVTTATEATPAVEAAVRTNVPSLGFAGA